MIDFDKLAADLANATPGPWEWRRKAFGDGWRLSPGILVVEPNGGNPCGDRVDRSNTELIAAAPDLARLALLVPELREALKHAALNMPHPDQCIDVALAKLDALLEAK